MCEIHSVDFDQLDPFFENPSRASLSSELGMHKVLMSWQENVSHSLKGRVGSQEIVDSSLDVQRVESFKRKTKPFMAMAGGSGKVEAGVTIRWGGENGVEASGYGKAEVHDDNGNRVAFEVEQKSDGTGSMTASVQREESDPQ